MRLGSVLLADGTLALAVTGGASCRAERAAVCGGAPQAGKKQRGRAALASEPPTPYWRPVDRGQIPPRLVRDLTRAGAPILRLCVSRAADRPSPLRGRVTIPHNRAPPLGLSGAQSEVGNAALSNQGTAAQM
jgi:hypothetical protein